MENTFLIPAEIEKFKDEILKKNSDRKFIKDDARFLETIYFLCDLVRRMTFEKRYEFCYISKSYNAKYSIQKIIPNSHRVLKVLVDDGIFRIAKKYKVGVNPTGYVFADKVIESGKFIKHIIHDEKIKTKVSDIQSVERFTEIEDVYWHLHRDLASIEIDESRALAHIKTLNLTSNQKKIYEHSVWLIKEKEFHFKVDKYGRLHSNITNLPRGLRQFISFRGRNIPLIELDMANIQPFLISLEILKNYNENGLQFDAQSQYAHGLLVNGVFYDKVEEDLNQKGIYLTRKDLKKQINLALYSLPKHNTDVKEVLKKIHPIMISFLNKFKNEFLKPVAIIDNTMAIPVRFVPVFSELFVPLISVQSVPLDS